MVGAPLWVLERMVKDVYRKYRDVAEKDEEDRYLHVAPGYG
jgi:hypothetical protein